MENEEEKEYKIKIEKPVDYIGIAEQHEKLYEDKINEAIKHKVEVKIEFASGASLADKAKDLMKSYQKQAENIINNQEKLDAKHRVTPEQLALDLEEELKNTWSQLANKFAVLLYVDGQVYFAKK